MTLNFSVKFLVSIEALITNITIQNQLTVARTIKRLQRGFFKSMPIIISALVHIKSLTFFSVILALTSASDDCTNHLHQEFNQKAPNIVWTSDFTYIKVGCKWYYLCIVMDLFSRKVISWHISGKPDVELVMTAFKKAYDKRNAPFGLMFHSDRGSQYTAFAFRQLLDTLNVVQSFSKKGYPFDNACCECFFKYLKKEEVNRKTYHSLQELHFSVFEYIEGFYNSKRPHGSLGMMTPNEKEELYREQA